MDVPGAEDVHEFAGELVDLGGPAVFDGEHGQLQGDEGGVVGHVPVQEFAADGGEDLPGFVPAAEAGGDAAFNPIEADLVEPGAPCAGKGPDLGEEGGGLGVAPAGAQR